MLRIWNLGRALGLLASSMPLESQVLPTDVSQTSTHTVHIDENYSTTVTVPTGWATAEPRSPHEQSKPIFIAAESPSVSTVWVEETVYVTVTVGVMPTASRTSEHLWMTATTPCPHVDDTDLIKPTMPGKRSVLARELDVSTVWVEETVYVTITVDVLPTTSGTSQRSWTTATTPCPHDDEEEIMKPTLPGKRAVVVREPIVTVTAVEEAYVTTEEVVYVTAPVSSSISLDLSSIVENYSPVSTYTIEAGGFLDLSSIISNYNPTSTYTVKQSVPPAETPVPASKAYEKITVVAPDSSTIVPRVPTLSLHHPLTTTMKPEDMPGYWLKGGIVSTRGHAVHRRDEGPSSVTTHYTHDVHPTIQASNWLGQFRNFARKEATTGTKRSTCVSTIPTLGAAPTSCSTTDVEERLTFKNSLTKSNKAREWLRRLVQRSDAITVYEKAHTTSTIRSFSKSGFPSANVVAIIDGNTTITTTSFARETSSESPSETSTQDITNTIFSTTTRSPTMSTHSQVSTPTSWSRSTTIWPDSATSWSPSSTPTPMSLEWDWYKGTKYQKKVSGEKKARSAAAAVEQKVEMSGWERAEDSVSLWVVTFGVVLAALSFALM